MAIIEKKTYTKPEISELTSAEGTNGMATTKITAKQEEGNSGMGPGFTAS